MKRIHGIVLTLSHNLLQACIVICCYLSKTSVCGVYDTWTLKTSCPPATIGISRHAGFLREVCGHHTRETRQDWVYTQFTLALYNLPGKRELALIPGIILDTAGTLPCSAIQFARLRSAPPFQVVHAPPCRKGRTRHEGLGFFVGIVILTPAIFLKGEEFAPDFLQAYDLQGHVDAMQGHPVYLSLPALPCPCSHRVAKSTIIQVVPILGIAAVSFTSNTNIVHVWQVCIGMARLSFVERIPRYIYPEIVFQEPPQTHSKGTETVCFNKHLVLLFTYNKRFACDIFHRFKGKDKLLCHVWTTDTFCQGHHRSGIALCL